MSLNVLAVASEIYPLIKTGGLADVAGALPAALKPHGVETTTLLPGYRQVMQKLGAAEPVAEFGDLFGGRARLLAGEHAGLDLLVIDAPHLYDRAGGPYSGPDGTDWPDNAYRFAALGRVAAEVARGAAGHPIPQVVHMHDWQAGLAAAYLTYAPGPRPKMVATIHNIAFQGWFPPTLRGALGLPDHAMDMDGVEYYGGVGFLKSALYFADRITTVSPTYASEILEPDGGIGLDGLLSARAADVSGVLNGVDTEVWNPATDPRLPARYSAADLSGRRDTRRALAERFGLDPHGTRLIFGVVSRLSSQKGLDLLAEAVPTILELGADLALIGSGEGWLEERFSALSQRHPGRVGCFIGYDEDLAHLMQAGADAILVPSRFEPCGLTQLCALRYGAVPVVARVGGLADTVIDANPAALGPGVATGVQFSPVCQSALETALRRTAALWADKAAWARIQQNGMAADVSWNASAGAYAALYRELVGNI
ncbi:glycogen synthase GlgA [Chenggangzhangella methanolivorans]|uniref:Glycogen synthase n=1 Tax=Chenggangzhangella methanolivorans TaxID=1437009 RepID=A0A9E6UML5_9HYPH|nr:glycogen synthase GlgA [Chenggangzhangella methanolivorans]QZN99313.1 glycogen synthase GlgA [Chenggangzhangella methanolivorans]